MKEDGDGKEEALCEIFSSQSPFLAALRRFD